MNKHIAKQIAIAQRASDLGKYYKLTEDQIAESEKLGQLLGKTNDARATKLEYRLKDDVIYDAIMGIGHNPGCGFHFRVTEDSEKLAKFIVYFDFRLNGRKVQVSFHSFDKRLKRFVEKQISGHWNRKSARQTCIELLSSL